MNRYLFVIDYQNDFVDGALGFPGAEKLDAAIAALEVNAESTTAKSTRNEKQQYANIPTVLSSWVTASERKAGDTGIVKTDNGYHVIYLESFDEYTYRNYLIMNDKLSEDLEAYLEEIVKNTTYTEVDLSRMNWDITFG